MTRYNQFDPEDFAQWVNEIQRRFEPIAPILEGCLRALVSTLDESDARILKSQATRLLNSGGLSDEQELFSANNLQRLRT